MASGNSNVIKPRPASGRGRRPVDTHRQSSIDDVFDNTADARYRTPYDRRSRNSLTNNDDSAYSARSFESQRSDVSVLTLEGHQSAQKTDNIVKTNNSRHSDSPNVSPMGDVVQLTRGNSSPIAYSSSHSSPSRDIQHTRFAQRPPSGSHAHNSYSPHPPSASQPSFRRHSSIVIDDVSQLPRRPGSSRYRVLPAISQNKVTGGELCVETKLQQQRPETDIVGGDSLAVRSSGSRIEHVADEQPLKAVARKMQSLSIADTTPASYCEQLTATRNRSDRRPDNLFRSTEPRDSRPQPPEQLKDSDDPSASDHRRELSQRSTSIDKDSYSDQQKSVATRQNLSSTSNLNADTRSQLSLAVKLPSGERVEGRFWSTDRLATVMQFAESAAKTSFTNCEFVCAEPRCILSDLRATIASCRIPDKSVFYVQLPPPDDK